MNRKECLSLETSKLTLKKGYNEPCYYFHDGDGLNCFNSEYGQILDFETEELISYVEPIFDWNSIVEKCKGRHLIALDKNEKIMFEYFHILCSAPNMFSVQRWLLDKHSLWCAAEPMSDLNIWRPTRSLKNGVIAIDETDWKKFPDTLESALEQAIFNTLKSL